MAHSHTKSLSGIRDRDMLTTIIIIIIINIIIIIIMTIPSK